MKKIKEMLFDALAGTIIGLMVIITILFWVSLALGLVELWASMNILLKIGYIIISLYLITLTIVAWLNIGLRKMGGKRRMNIVKIQKELSEHLKKNPTIEEYLIKQIEKCTNTVWHKDENGFFSKNTFLDWIY